MSARNSPSLASSPAPRLGVVIFALGIAQILSWGSFYYAIAVLGEAMQRELGVSQPLLFGAFTLSLVVSGLAAPAVGRLIDARGGRRVLCAGSLIGALALLMLAGARGPVTLAIASIASGIAMAVCLYDAAFITLNQLAGEHYRRSVTLLTLYGGFASTVSWPLSQLLLDALGWRGALMCYAALQLMVCLPLHAWLLPSFSGTSKTGLDSDPEKEKAKAASAGASDSGSVGNTKAMPGGAAYFWLAVALALGSFVMSVLSVHLIGLFKTAGLSARDAVFVASLIGPMQVLGRLIEMGVARQVQPLAVGTVTFALMPAALLALFFVDGLSPLAFVMTALYGFANGLLTIVRGTVPAALFGREGFGALLGRLGRPAFIARALAPGLFALAMSVGLANGHAILVLGALAVLALLAYRAALRAAAR